MAGECLRRERLAGFVRLAVLFLGLSGALHAQEDLGSWQRFDTALHGLRPGEMGVEHPLLLLWNELEAKRQSGGLGEPDVSALLGSIMTLASSREVLGTERAFLPEARELLASADELVRNRYGRQADDFAAYHAAHVAIALLGGDQPQSAEMACAWALGLGPSARKQARLELHRLRSRAANERGRRDEAKSHLVDLDRELQEILSREVELTATEEAALRTAAASAWAYHWIELGVLDLADRRLKDAEDLMREHRVFSFQTLNCRMEWLKRANRHEDVLVRVESWRKRYQEALELDPRAREILETAEIRSLFEVADNPEQQRRARARLEELLERGATFTSLDRCRMQLSLAGESLARADLPDVDRRLARIEELVGTGNDLSSLELQAGAHSLRYRFLVATAAAPSALQEARDALEASFRNLLASWEGARRERGGIGFLMPGNHRALLGSVLEASVREGDVKAALEWGLAVHAQGSLARDLGIETPPELSQLREALLEEDHGILAFFPGTADGSHLFAIDREGIRHVHLPAHGLLSETARSLEEQLAVHPGSILPAERGRVARRLERAGLRLSALLFPTQVLELLASWKAVTLVGTELFTTVPLECLPLTDGRTFGHAWAVDTLPSLAAGTAIAARPRREHAHAVGLIASLSGARSSAVRELMPGIRLEQRKVPPAVPRRLLAPFQGTSCWSLCNEKVTKATLLEDERGRLADTALVHFLVHGAYRPDLERGACLVIGAHDDPRETLLLSCDEVEDRLALSGVVLLSSCATALGPRRMGDDELGNLGSAFLRAGARAVVLSRMPMEYTRTLNLMERVHQELARGASVAEALQRMRVALASEDDPLSSWLDAQVRVVGLGQERPLSLEPSATSKPPR